MKIILIILLSILAFFLMTAFPIHFWITVLVFVLIASTWHALEMPSTDQGIAPDAPISQVYRSEDLPELEPEDFEMLSEMEQIKDELEQKRQTRWVKGRKINR